MKRLLFVFLLLSACGFAQMVDPAIDRDGEPFSYFSHPTDVIGVMDGGAGTLVSPEGYLFTGYGELMFFTGHPSQPAEQRSKRCIADIFRSSNTPIVRMRSSTV